jgi:hypothetical protein
MKKWILTIIIGILCLNVVSALSCEGNNCIDFEYVDPLGGANITLFNTNSSDYWDELDTPMNITEMDSVLFNDNVTLYSENEISLNITSKNEAKIYLVSDTDNNNEYDNPAIHFVQDGSIVQAFMGFATGGNHFLLHNKYSDDLRLGTGYNVNMLTLEGNANEVGIFNTAPAYTLDVNGTGQFEDVLYCRDKIYAYNDVTIQNDDNVILNLKDNNDDNWQLINSYGNMYIKQYTGSDETFAIRGDNNIDRFHLNLNNGNTKINGTTDIEGNITLRKEIEFKDGQSIVALDSYRLAFNTMIDMIGSDVRIDHDNGIDCYDSGQHCLTKIENSHATYNSDLFVEGKMGIGSLPSSETLKVDGGATIKTELNVSGNVTMDDELYVGHIIQAGDNVTIGEGGRDPTLYFDNTNDWIMRPRVMLETLPIVDGVWWGIKSADNLNTVIQIKPANTNSSQRIFMMPNSAGKVTIGNSNVAGEMLRIDGSSRIVSSATGNPFMAFERSAGNKYAQFRYEETGVGAIWATGLRLNSDNYKAFDIANSRSAMDIEPGGNVGINITNPSYTLHVDGDAYFTGTVFADNFTDFTPAWSGSSREALDELVETGKTYDLTSGSYEIDHETLPEFTQGETTMTEKRNCTIETDVQYDEDGNESIYTEEFCDYAEVTVPTRLLPHTITMQTESIIALNNMVIAMNETIVTQQAQIDALEDAVCDIDSSYAFCPGLGGIK